MTRLKEIAKGQKRLTKAKLFKKNTIDLLNLDGANWMG